MADIYRRIEDEKERVVLFRPVYRQQGNITEYFYTDDDQLKRAYDQRNLLTVRQSLARSYNLDLSAQSRDLKKVLNRKFPIPFYLPDGRVFVPLKMRRPLIAGDSTYGYVDITYIKSVRKINKEVILTLTSEDQITLYSSSAASYSIINLGKEIVEYINDHMDNEQDRILDAIGILINKIYSIEKILNKF